MERLTVLRRLVIAALTISTLMTLAPAAPAQAQPTSRISSNVCRIDWSDGQRGVRKLIRCAARRWHVSGGPSKAVSVARCESGLNPEASSGRYAGVFQQSLTYWPRRAKTFGFRKWSAYNGRANIIVSVRMAHRWGWSAWSCA